MMLCINTSTHRHNVPIFISDNIQRVLETAATHLKYLLKIQQKEQTCRELA